MAIARKNNMRIIKFRTKRDYTIIGFVLGLLFPLFAWSSYLIIYEYSFSLSVISQIHQENPCNPPAPEAHCIP